MIKDFLEYAKNKGISNVQVNNVIVNQTTLETMNNNITNYEIVKNESFEIKALIDDKIVSYSALGLKHENFKEIIEKLLMAKDIQDEKQDVIFYSKNCEKKIDRKTSSCDIKLWQKRLLKLNDIRKNNSLIKTINTFFRENVISRIIENTNEFKVFDSSKNYSLYIEVVVEKDNKMETFSKSIYQIDDSFNERELLDEVLTTAINKLEYEVPSKGKYNLILSEKVISSILESFLSCFTASEMMEKTSIFQESFNKKIASSKVSLEEQVENINLCGYRYFDDEGTKTKNKDIIKKGIFKTIAYDLKSAKQNNLESTGNYYGNISFKNLTLLPSNKTKEELFSLLNDGIYITEVHGLHSGIDRTTGIISLQATGMKVENKKVTKALKEFIISTNIFELLENIKEVSDKVVYTNDIIGCPLVLVEDITVSS